MDSRPESIDFIWKLYAPAYSRVLPHLSFYVNSLERMVASVSGHHKILDIGCGPGLLAEKLAAKGHEVISIDKDETMVRYAAQRLEHYPNVRVDLQDASSLQTPSSTIDGIVCNNVVYYVDDPLQMFRESYRVLKDGGVFSVSGPTRSFNRHVLDEQMERELKEKGLYDALSKDIEIIKKCNEIIALRGIKNPFDNSELESILLSVGFNEILTSDIIYLGQCYFISACKQPIGENDLLNHDAVRQNVLVGKRIEYPTEFKPLVLGNYVFDVAKTPQEMVEIFGLRYRAYSRAGLFKPGSLQSPYDFDKFDRNAVLVYARNLSSGRIEVTNRLILDSEMGLYLERSFNISHLRGLLGRIAEGSRLAADPIGHKVPVNGTYMPVSDVVLARTAEFAKYIGVNNILGLSRLKLKDFFTRNGFFPLREEIEPINLKDGKINPNEDLYPVVQNVEKVFEETVKSLLRQ